MIQDYGIDIQKLFLEFMITDPQLYVRVQNIFNPENFDRGLRSTATFIAEHSADHNSLPDVNQVKAVAGIEFNTDLDINEGRAEWYLEEFEAFTKRKELERAIMKSVDHLEEGDFAPVEKLIKDAVQISLTKDMGTDYFEDPKARLTLLKDSNGQLSTGWPSLDKLLYGGFNRGELQIFAGGSGSGKSLIMQNLAVNWAMQGLNGVYISMELSEGLCSMRLDSMITGVPSNQIFKDIDDVELKVKMFSKKAGDLRIKYMPAGSTVNDMRAYFRELEIQLGKQIDFVCVDYLDLANPAGVKVNASDQFIKDKYVSEEFRNLAKELNILFVTASQLNRCLALNTKVIANKKEIEIKNVQVGDWLESNEGPVQVYEKLPITKQPVYKIKTKSGKEIICSAKHNFPTEDGLKSIENGLQPGSVIYQRPVE